MNITTITQYTINLLVLISRVSACPNLCHCSGRSVSCPDSAVIPEDIPESTIILSFRSHLFTNLPSNTFVLHNLHALEELQLDYGNLEVIGANAFHGLPALESLQLRSNNINFIDPKAFDGLANVRILYLTDNNLQQLSPRQFEGLDNLSWMSLSENSLVTIPPNAFQGLGNLKSLYLRHNGISELTSYESFSGLHKLTHLSIQNNQGLRYIGDETFSQLYNLERLDLDGNQISAEGLTQATFAGLHKLRVLNLDNNPLIAVPAIAFKAIPQLRVLYMSNGQLEFIQPGAFQYLPNLLEVTLDKNYHLINIPQYCFHDMPELQILKLSDNSIQELKADIFPNTSQLSKLEISKTKLSKLNSGVFFNLTKIRILDLSDNELQSLPADIFASIPFSTSLRIDLRNNPWVCDCHLLGFLRSTNKLYTASQIGRVFNISRHHPQCLNPLQLAETPIFSIPLSNLTCSPPSPSSNANEAVAITSGCLSITVAIAIIAAICVFWQKCKHGKMSENVQYGSRQNFMSLPLDDNVSVEDMTISHI